MSIIKGRGILNYHWRFRRFSHFFHSRVGKKLAGLLFFRIGKIVQLGESRTYFGFKIPAGHLTHRKPTGKFIGRNGFIPLANLKGDVKCFANWEFAVVKNGSCRCGFFTFAFCAPSGKGRFTRTIIVISAFPAHKFLSPLNGCNEFQALLIILKQYGEFLLSQIVCKEIFHLTKIVIIKRFK
jgi:hypothetical protein